MENNETLTTTVVSNPTEGVLNRELIIDDFSKENLLETTKWMYFLSIIGFISIGLMALAGLVLLVFGQKFRSGTITGIGYIIGAGLYIFPLLYLYKSAVNFKKAIAFKDQLAVTDGFDNLKSHYKFIGIFTIIVLSIYVLMLIVGFLAFFMR